MSDKEKNPEYDELMKSLKERWLKGGIDTCRTIPHVEARNVKFNIMKSLDALQTEVDKLQADILPKLKALRAVKKEIRELVKLTADIKEEE